MNRNVWHRVGDLAWGAALGVSFLWLLWEVFDDRDGDDPWRVSAQNFDRLLELGERVGDLEADLSQLFDRVETVRHVAADVKGDLVGLHREIDYLEGKRPETDQPQEHTETT